MLDVYIIDRLRREQERPQSSYIPLYIEPPQPHQDGPPHEEEEREEPSQHGVVIIDYFSDPED